MANSVAPSNIIIIIIIISLFTVGFPKRIAEKSQLRPKNINKKLKLQRTKNTNE